MNDSRRLAVFTVHGANPDRTWQERAKGVLEPHFKCHSLEYPEYDKLTGLCSVFMPVPLLVIALSALALAGWLMLYGSMVWAIAPLVAFVFIAMCGLWLARRARENQARRLKLQLDKKAPLERPHLIAHSLGTYLVGVILRDFHDVRLNRVVLVSSVLPRRFPWDRILNGSSGRAREVRNEFGARDFVTKTVRWLGWLMRDMGGSGVLGFLGSRTLIHNHHSSTSRCHFCNEAPVKLHNIPLNHLHSDPLLGTGHARRLWLPYLWGYSSDELFGYVEACQEVVLLQADDLVKADAKAGQMWLSEYPWTNSRPLNLYMEQLVVAVLKEKKVVAPPAADVTNIAQTALSVLHVVMASASCDDPDEAVVRRLHPILAMRHAASYAVSEHPLGCT